MPFEDLVGGHADSHVEVARPGAPLAGPSLARDPDLLAFVDARGYLDGDRPLRRPAAGAAALGAGLLDYLAGPGTPRADPGLDELPQDGPPHGADLASTPALGARLDR